MTIMSINQQQQQQYSQQANRPQQQQKQQQQQQSSVQQQPMMLFDNRKRSAEQVQQQFYHQQQQQPSLHSKSTKVSPTRLSGVHKGKGNSAFDGVKQQQMHSMEMQQQQIPQQQHNYQHFDMEGIIPAMVSHTAGGAGKKVMQHQQSEDLGQMDNSMHQSFINLIYPSKSKKLMGNEVSLQQQQQFQPTHQKSKSLYVGGSQHLVQNFVKPVAQQLAPKSGNNSSQSTGVQKIQSTSYKKQSSIFNYSQRFKELLNETIGEDIVQPSQNTHQQQKLFSQQHSPTSNAQQYMQHPQHHIMVNFNDINYQQQQQQRILKGGTFDNKPSSMMIQQMLMPHTQQQQQYEQQRQPVETNNKTIDYTGGNTNNLLMSGQQQQQQYKNNNLHNTPNSTNLSAAKAVVMQSKSKIVADHHPTKNLLNNNNSSSLHQRKPSHPVTNNFMLELLSGPPQQQQHLVQSFAPSNNAGSHHQIDLSASSRPMIGNSMDQQHRHHQQLAQYQQLQPVREKKQHQPTQSKQSKQQQPMMHHQRSASDYTQQPPYEQQQQNLMRFLNSESYDHIMNMPSSQRQQFIAQENMVESFENNLDCTTITHSGQVNLNDQILQNSQRGPPVIQQQAFSQMLYDGSTPQLSHRQQQQYMQQQQQQPSSSNNPSLHQDKQMMLSAVQSSATIYHHRKMSLQQPPTSSASSHTLQVKKSPSKVAVKQQYLGIQSASMDLTTSTKQATKRRGSSPTTTIVAKQPEQQYNNYMQQPKKVTPVVVTSSKQASMRGSQVSSPSNKKVMIPSTQQNGYNNNNAIIVPQQFAMQQPMHNRSNSDLMKQQILSAQQAAMKKQSQQVVINRPNPAINTQQQATPNMNQQQYNNVPQVKAKSELTTPRQMTAQSKVIITQQQQQQPQSKKGTTGSTTPANVSIDLVQKQQSSSRGVIAKNSSSNNLQSRPQTVAIPSSQQQQHTPRLHQQSPPTSKQQQQAKRFSVQNSPRAQQQQSNKQYNLSQQYQMFQQVIKTKTSTAQPKTEAVSPKNSFSKARGSAIAPSKSNEKEDQLPSHRRGVSETEYLLNQIRNNINTLKAYNPYQQEQAQQDNFDQYLKKEPKPAYKKETLQIVEDNHNNNHYLQTDPNLSPYSKDLYKLQKLIKFNFRKFHEPPPTTSEFYRIGRVLGRGAFGKVNLAAHKLSEQLVAIKSINKEFLRSSKSSNAQPMGEGQEHPERKKVMQEFAILKQSNHESVVRLYDTFETSKHICFVMELCAGGDLLTYVRKRRKLTEEIAKYFFKQLIEGLAYLHHSKLIVHRDIKLDNILLDGNGKIKIADFGVSRQVQTEAERMSEQCGTPAYIAPEILKDKGYDGFKVDVWSAGVCLYAMLIGTVPFKAASMQELHHLIINGKYDINNPNANCNKDGNTATQQQQPPTKLSEGAQNLIHSLLQVDPRKRLSAVEVLGHPWLKDAKEELDVFTQKEKDVIHKEYLSKNIDRAKPLHLGNTGQLSSHYEETEVIFTEHNLDTRTNVGSLLKNASTKSIILAPFNSTVSEIIAEGETRPWPDEVKRMILPKRVLKFAPKVKDLDRQYEHNNNADLDNGVYNNIGNEDDPAAILNNSDDEALSSQDSLKRSFKETELSSDDERAEQQLEEARKGRKLQQSELEEFEQQVRRLKYSRYQEPQEIIDNELVSRIVDVQAVYPRDYVLKVVQAKDMNYATANYYLLLKKHQFLLKHAMI